MVGSPPSHQFAELTIRFVHGTWDIATGMPLHDGAESPGSCGPRATERIRKLSIRCALRLRFSSTEPCESGHLHSGGLRAARGLCRAVRAAGADGAASEVLDRAAISTAGDDDEVSGKRNKRHESTTESATALTRSAARTLVLALDPSGIPRRSRRLSCPGSRGTASVLLRAPAPSTRRQALRERRGR